MKTLDSLYIHIFLCDFGVHHTILRYIVCPKEYTDLSSRSRSGIASKDTKQKDKEARSLKKNSNNNRKYSSIQKKIEFATTLLFQRIQVFTIVQV